MTQVIGDGSIRRFAAPEIYPGPPASYFFASSLVQSVKLFLESL